MENSEDVNVKISEETLPEDFLLHREKLWGKRIELEKKLNLYEGDEEDWITLGGLIKVGVLKSILKLTGLFNRGVSNASKVRLNKVKFVIPNLPQSLHGFKILFASDLHLSKKYLGWYISAESILKNLREDIDLILLGGDYRYGYFGDENFIIPMIMEMFGSLEPKYGIYGVMGNHDVSYIKEEFEKVGIKILVNEGVEIEHNSTKIWIGGVDDPHGFQCCDVSLALAGKPKDSFTILLSHSPDVYEESALWGVDLVLCGHTHGGQIAFPLLGAVYYNTSAPRKFGYGKWNYFGVQGYTTSGIGTTDVPVRFNTSPEIVLITLLGFPFEDKLLNFKKLA